MNNSSWAIPSSVKQLALNFFTHAPLSKAVGLCHHSKVNMSFSKGGPGRYFITSGIIKDGKTFECKITYKKTEDSEKIDSKCNCSGWTKDRHCSHVAALFILFHMQNLSQLDHTHEDHSQHVSNIISPQQYGQVVISTKEVDPLGLYQTFTQYRFKLTNDQVISFPNPIPFIGKIYLDLKTKGQTIDSITFKHALNESINAEVTLLENTYLFCWNSGVVYLLPTKLRTFLQSNHLRRYHAVNALINYISQEDYKDLFAWSVNEATHDSIDSLKVISLLELSNSSKNGHLELTLQFENHLNEKIAPPEILTAFTFGENGLLDGLGKKSTGNKFFEKFIEASNVNQLKMALFSAENKDQWNRIFDNYFNHSHSIVYDNKLEKTYEFENQFVKNLFKSLFDIFQSKALRFSHYHPQEKKITYHVPRNILVSNLNNLYQNLYPFGLQIYYDGKEVKFWTGNIRFERNNQVKDWFELTMEVNDQDLQAIKRADIENGVILTDEGLTLISKEQKKVLKYIKRYAEFEGQKEVDPETNKKQFHFPLKKSRIFELFELKKLGLGDLLNKEELELCETLTNIDKIPEIQLNEEMDQTLREYQKTGHQWIQFLFKNKLGGCLADDMGLGKTIQTISFIQSNIDKVGNILIVCPVSILINWQREFQKFSQIDTQVYHGGDRNFNPDVKVTITSYGVLKKEYGSTFKDIMFDIFVLDEVQHLKNLKSQGAYAARMINSRFNLCLTGTPVENDLSEFYNILDLSVPGIWGDLNFIRSKSSKKSRLLARNTASPFILRRTKSQVLKELPPKEINNVLLEFSPEEKINYVQSIKSIRHQIDHAGKTRKYGMILKGLLELRQKCLWQYFQAQSNAPVVSTKINFLLDNLEQILEEGHQTIVFSQFTTYLDIIEKKFSEKNWPYARIDGSQSIKKRNEQVDLFQNGKKKIFLISLKAGGVGLNLTAASYVFMMDPWWNPAVENQAIDRAHRIGQKNTLTIYRPIIQHSVEEKVLELQEKKRELFSELLPEDDDTSLSAKLSKDEFEKIINDSFNMENSYKGLKLGQN